jgi:hypothetical protein
VLQTLCQETGDTRKLFLLPVFYTCTAIRAFTNLELIILVSTLVQQVIRRFRAWCLECKDDAYQHSSSKQRAMSLTC